MGCYIVPASAFIVHKVLQKRGFLLSPQQNQLSLLLLGGSLFGLVDHAWNRELLFSKNWAFDLLLGVAITGVIFAVWTGMLFVEKWKVTTPIKN